MNIVNQCMQCRSKQNLINLFGMNEYMCQKCIAQQGNQIVELKKGRPKLYPSNNYIIDGIYLGNQDTAMDITFFQSNNVTAVLACGSYLLSPFQNQFQYKKLNIADFPSQKISHLFQQCYKWIKSMQNQNRKILIHCAAGISRSSSFTIAFLMKQKKWTYQQTFKFVHDKRNTISPNSGFRKQLEEYGQLLKKQNNKIVLQ